ncbi:MAG: hypothetical protein AAFS07_18700 [Pseudomonadota bacterium]
MVEVFDDVLPAAVLDALDDFPADCFRGASSRTLVRPIADLPRSPGTDPVRRVLHAVRRCVAGAGEGFVEVWGRHRAELVPFHVDCDEALLTRDHLLRTPAWGHVLYLREHHPAPTLFCDGTHLTVVPPRRNRLVRFPGHLLHMVLPIEGLEETRRSVLLFNHWPTLGPGMAVGPGGPDDGPDAEPDAGPDAGPAPVAVRDVGAPADPAHLHVFPSMYTDRYATNADLPRGNLPLYLHGVRDLRGAVLTTRRRQPWRVRADPAGAVPLEPAT